VPGGGKRGRRERVQSIILTSTYRTDPLRGKEKKKEKEVGKEGKVHFEERKEKKWDHLHLPHNLLFFSRN